MSRITEETSKIRLLLLGIRRKPGIAEVSSFPTVRLGLRYVGSLPLDGARLSLEPVRNENLVLVVFVASSKNIGTLQCLAEEAENVVDGYDALSSLCRSSDVWNLSVDDER